MPVTKLRTNNTLDALKPMADNSVNTFIRQAVGNESFLSFSRTGDNPVQWVQLLNALDQPGGCYSENVSEVVFDTMWCNKWLITKFKGFNPVSYILADLPGWPFLTPVKVQMQKCDKCSREFCSPINYRRHLRVHRRSFCADKEWHKNRDLLGAFWDKLSEDTAKEIVSFDDVTLEGVPGSSIMWSLSSFVRKPGYGAFPQQYVKAGSALLDIIQSRPARLPISSHELFDILDDASEGTFLSAGEAESMQKFMFDGEAGKIGMEPKNLVACTSFLVEQKLVRGWVAEMDAESLRCQKLLVEEEDAAQRRQAKLLERKRQKKLRQKEQKAKEQVNGESAELEAIILTLDSPDSSEPTNLSTSSESSSNFIETPVDHPLPLSLSVEPIFIPRDTDVVSESGFSSENSDIGLCPNIEHQRAFEIEHRYSNVSRWQVQKTQRVRNGLHSGQNPHLSKVEPMPRNDPSRDPKSTQALNGNKVWTRKSKQELDNRGSCNTKMDQAGLDRKPKPEYGNRVGFNKRGQEGIRTHKPKPEENNGESVNIRVEETASTQSYQTEQNCEVMIGSISVNLGSCNKQPHSEHTVSENSGQEKQTKPIDRVSRSKVKLWRPVSRQGNRDRSSGGESTEEIVRENNERGVLSESCQRSCDYDNASGSLNHVQEGIIRPEGFSTEAAKAFLSQRWKEAIAGDHVTLVLTPETKLLDCEDAENDFHVIKPSSDSQSCTVLGNVENLQENVVVFEPSTNRPVKGKVKSNPEKGVKTKYIPKKNIVTG